MRTGLGGFGNKFGAPEMKATSAAVSADGRTGALTIRFVSGAADADALGGARGGDCCAERQTEYDPGKEEPDQGAP